MKYLIVVAHPDDEILGAGATIHHLSQKGDEINVCVLSHWSPTRDDDLTKGIKESHSMIKILKSYIGDFGCMKFKDEDHHAVVRFIESAIKDCQPDKVITHHPADVHADHKITCECCMEAVRLPQRQICEISPIKAVMFMEVLSSTDWNINTSLNQFVPNQFYEVDKEDVDMKIKAIAVYDKVLRESPHPRSSENIMAMAHVRGSQAGVRYAEGFQQIFGLEK